MFCWVTLLVGFSSPVSIFVIPSTEIIVANALRNYSANFGGGAGLVGGIAALLILGETWDLVTNGEFWRIDMVVISLAGILG